MAVIKEGIELVVTQKGAKIVRREIEKIGTAGQKSAVGVKGLSTSLKFLSAGLVAREIITLVDTFTNMQNRMKLVTTGTANLKAVTSELGDIARRTRTSYEGTATIFSRVALATKELGVSQESLLHFTESLNQATILSGASSKEAFNGIIQLSQGMGAGALRGDELRSVLEQLPAVADTIARGMGVARASLRDLGKEGAITSAVILDAFSKDRVRLMTQFAETVPTMGQAFEVVRTDVIFFLATLDQALGASSAVANAMILIGTHINELGFIVVGVATFFAVNYVIALTAATTATGVFTAALSLLAKNRITLIISALVAVIGYLITFRQKLAESEGILGVIGGAIQGVVTFITILSRVLGKLNALFDRAFGDAAGPIKAAGVAIVGLTVFFKIFSVNLVQVRLGILAVWAALKANPFTVIATLIGLAGAALWAFRENLGFLGDLIQSIGDIFARVFTFIKEGLAELGIIELGKNGEIKLTISGDEAAGDIKGSLKEGGDIAAAALKDGVKDGGKEAAKSLKASTKDIGSTLEKSGKKAGQNLGDKAGEVIVVQAQKMDGIFSAFSSQGIALMNQAAAASGFALQTAAQLLHSAVSAQIGIMQEQALLLQAQTEQTFAQSELLRAQATNLRLGGGNSGGSSGGNTTERTVSTSAVNRPGRAFESPGLFFDKGGSFAIGGNSGVDKNTLSVNNRPIANVSKGETVTVTPDGKRKGKNKEEREAQAPIVVFNITTPDANSFQRSQPQIQARMSAALMRANTRNN